MVQLFADQTFGSVAKPGPFRGAFGSFMVHTLLLLFVVSLAYSPITQGLPDRLIRLTLAAPSPPPPPLPPPPVIKSSAIPVPRAVRVFSAALTAPVAIPQHAVVGIVDAAPEIEIGGVPGGIPGGIPGGVFGGVIGVPALPPPPPPPVKVVQEVKPPEPVAPVRIQVSSDIQEGKLLVMIPPEYPMMAKQARVQGAVHLTAIIDPNGNITELKVLEGNPLLVVAARNAVQKWRYRPTFLNGAAVEVATDIIVKFRLAI